MWGITLKLKSIFQIHYGEGQKISYTAINVATYSCIGTLPIPALPLFDWNQNDLSQKVPI
jgi:hypothetical protein